MPPLSKNKRPGRWAFDAAVALLCAAIALWTTSPWIAHPASSVLGFSDPKSGLLATDVMLSLSLSGWFKFAALHLHAWPLAHTPYLMFPCAAAHGASFDGLALALLTSLLWLVAPLPLAFSVALLLGQWATGFLTYRLGKRLWGRGALAAAVGLSAAAMPYFMQRMAAHPNLTHIWVFPALIHLHLNWRAKPGWKRAAALGLAPLMLAASSWYFLLAGMLYLMPALLSNAGEDCWQWQKWKNAGEAAGLPPNVKPALAAWGRLAAGFVLGGAGVLFIGWNMFFSPVRRLTFTVNDLASLSVPLAQYFLPFPLTYGGLTAWASHWQARLGTSWEGWAGGPLAALWLCPFYFVWRRPGGPRRALGLALLAALIAAAGPYLQIMRALPPGEGIKTPVYYFGKLCPGLLAYRVPGRIHPLVNILALLCAGCLIHGWFTARPPKLAAEQTNPSRGQAGRRALYGAILIAFMGLNLWGSLSPLPYAVTPAPGVPPFYKTLAGKPGGAVLDLPVSAYWLPHYNYFQLFHGRPAVSSTMFHDAMSPADLKYILASPQLLALSDYHGVNAGPLQPPIASLAWLDRLGRDGIEYVVLHADGLELMLGQKAVQPALRQTFAECAAAWRARLVYQDGQIRAYRAAAIPAPEK